MYVPGSTKAVLHNVIKAFKEPEKKYYYRTLIFGNRHLGSLIFAFQNTLTTTLNHKTCINTSGQGF